MVMLVVMGAILSVAAAAGEPCQLPEQLIGRWDSSRPGWQDLVITNTTINAIPDDQSLQYTCFLNEGQTYVIESSELKGLKETYNLYICLDIVPSETDPYIVFFHIRTEVDEFHQQPVEGIFTSDDGLKTIEHICSKNATELPLDYNIFLMEGYEELMGNESCPRDLQAMFAVNFTEETEQRKCPKGFVLDGCNLTHLVFNYTTCGQTAEGLAHSGTPSYTCLTWVKNEEEDIVYTIVMETEETAAQQSTSNEFFCVTEQPEGEDLYLITKNPGMCGRAPAVMMDAVETKSCRSAEPPTTTAPPGTTTSSENTTQTSGPTTPGTDTGDGEQGGGGDGNACSVSWGILSILLPALISLLSAVKM